MRTFRLKCEELSVVVGFDVNVLSYRIALSAHSPSGDRTLACSTVLQRPRFQSWFSNRPCSEKMGSVQGHVVSAVDRRHETDAARHVVSLLLELAYLRYPWQVIERAPPHVKRTHPHLLRLDDAARTAKHARAATKSK
eukprot:7218547-Pyramimonas_sp.AAC.1